jgi:NAD(P)-dependent dehydrogenase (short-subunit alcohol dehydrogenase family)
MAHDKAILVVGAGNATGGAIARRFAREGYVACVTRRNAEKLDELVARIRAEGGVAHPFGSDARQEDEVAKLFEHIERDIAPLEMVAFNVGGNVRFGITELTARVYRKVWEMGAYAGFLVGRAAAKAMLPRARARSCSLAPPRACAAEPGSRRSPGPSMRCARWPRAWRANWARRASMSPTRSSTEPSTPSSSATIFRSATR